MDPYHRLLNREHALYLREWSEFYCGPPLECKRCGGDIHEKSVYCCEECEIFMHKPCAEAPPLTPQIHHPFHPQHPLTFLTEGMKYCRCNLCDKRGTDKDWFYTCESCDFDLHFSCTVATLPNNEEKVDGTTLQNVDHIHEHPLYSLVVKSKQRFRCLGCNDFIFGEAYVCYQCQIFFDKACIDASPPPREIQHHPFHPQHPLELILDGSHLRYSCKECNNVAFHMSALISTLPYKEEDDVRKQESRSAIHHFAHHQHPLNPYHAAKEIPYDCNACCKPIVNGFYGCTDCLFLIHESCAQLPSEIRHSLHADHPLSLVPKIRQEKNPCCESCRYFGILGFAYYCGPCDFALHIECALKTLVYLEGGTPSTIQHFSHKHELALHHFSHNHELTPDCNLGNCYGCARPLEGPGYKCGMKYGCKFFIHKSCLELPPIVQQSFHSHPLALCHEESDDGLTCCACGMKYCHFMFSCAECKLNFDAACASLERHTLREHLHEHDLFYVAEYHGKSPCKICGKWCRVDLFHCLECGVSVHHECVHALSETIVSNFHVDPLTLCESIIEDEYGEYYCDICEGRRDPELWVYYCAECQFIAHVKCAISLVRPNHVKENRELPRLDDEIGRAQQVVDAMEADLNGKEESLKALKTKFEALERKFANILYLGTARLPRPLHWKLRDNYVDCSNCGPLYPRRLGEHYRGAPLKCDCCGGVILHGSEYYCCELCRFFVHKHPCAEAPPPQIQRHPFHPQHPLILQMSEEDDFSCYLCRGFYPIYKDWFYRCESCSDFKLHAICAVRALLDNEDKADGATLQNVEHIHEHPLSSLIVKLKFRFVCQGCNYHIFGEAYACHECRIFFHKACVDGPRDLLFDNSRIDYSCKEPFNMSTLISTLPHKEDDVREEESRSTIHHFAHEHLLNPYDAAAQIEYDCKACEEPIVDRFYGCIDCRFLIHESCAEAPSKIQHYLHPNHPLSFTPKLKDHNQFCESCKGLDFQGLAYYCGTCDVALHMRCARKTLFYLEEGAPETIQHFSHHHRLTLHEFSTKGSYRGHNRNCYGCARSLEGPGYECRMKDCEFFIHKSCLELLPIIQQPSHSHPLAHRHAKSDEGLACCACGMKCGRFVFSCAECKLNFDAPCATLERPILKERLHKHDLFYVSTYWQKSPCKVCGKQCHVDLFRCWECGISVHYDCIHLLSKTIVSNFHVDPLTLNESVVEDDYGEYYCDICEGRRDPELWVYYCAECQFIAHLKCATSLVRLDFMKEKHELRQLEKVIELVQPQVAVMEANVEECKASLETPRKELEALKIRRENLACQSERDKESWTTSSKTLEKSSKNMKGKNIRLTGIPCTFFI